MYSPVGEVGVAPTPPVKVIVHTLIKPLPFVGFTLFYLSVFHPFVRYVRFAPLTLNVRFVLIRTR